MFLAESRKTIDHSKRSFLNLFTGASALATVAMLLGPAASPDFRAIAAGQQKKPSLGGDIAIATAAIQLEQKAVNTYKAAIAADLIKNTDYLDLVVEFINDHGEHRDLLTRALRTKLKGQQPVIENLGTFPIPKQVTTGRETEIIRYALAVEIVAAKTYHEAIKDKLSSDEAKGLVASILAVETQHAAVYRTVLMSVIKERGLADDNILVPFSFFSEQPMPQVYFMS
ncbi:MAG: ferritin-like domain-containing protein [Blastocatellia bacterium]|nr:ferritin-like domain-containing protein [Blastocatellia bacterium]